MTSQELTNSSDQCKRLEKQLLSNHEDLEKAKAALDMAAEEHVQLRDQLKQANTKVNFTNDMSTVL